MKKIVILLGLILISFTVVLAQEPSTVDTPKGKRNPQKPVVIKDDGLGHKLNFGLSFAPTIDWMFPSTTGFERSGSSFGMRYGLNINVNLTLRKNYYVSTGFMIERLGGKMKFIDNIAFPIPIDSFTVTTTGIDRHYKAHYLTIPLGVTLKSKSLRNFFVVGNFGLYNSILLRASNSDTYTFSNWQTGEPEYWTKQSTPSSETALFKESAYAGLGFEYSITKNCRAGVTVNYAHSLTNYFKGRGNAQNNFTHEDQNAKLGYLELVFNINFF